MKGEMVNLNVILENNSNAKTSKYKYIRIHIYACKSRLVVNLVIRRNRARCVSTDTHSSNMPFGVSFIIPGLSYSHIKMALIELTTIIFTSFI